jgi:hypothetical protein
VQIGKKSIRKEKKPWKCGYTCPGGAKKKGEYKKKKRNPGNMHMHVWGCK